MLTKKALIDSSGKVLDVLPIGLEYTPPEGTQWILCPPETNTEWEWRGGDFVRPPAPPVVEPPISADPQAQLSQKVEALTSVVEFLVKGTSTFADKPIASAAAAAEIVETVKQGKRP